MLTQLIRSLLLGTALSKENRTNDRIHTPSRHNFCSTAGWCAKNIKNRRVNMTQVRTIAGAAQEIKMRDPQTAITENCIR